jgi:hypothetical protein
MVDDIGVLFELCKELGMKTEEVLDCLDIRAVGDGWINLELKGWLRDSQFKTLCKLVKNFDGIRLGTRDFRIPVVLLTKKTLMLEMFIHQTNRQFHWYSFSKSSWRRSVWRNVNLGRQILTGWCPRLSRMPAIVIKGF